MNRFDEIFLAIYLYKRDRYSGVMDLKALVDASIQEAERIIELLDESDRTE